MPQFEQTDSYDYHESERYQQLIEVTGFEERVGAENAPSYNESPLYQAMMAECGLKEISSGKIVHEETYNVTRKAAAVLNMSCADCLQKQLATLRSAQELRGLIMRVRDRMSSIDMQSPLPEDFIHDAAELESLVLQARKNLRPQRKDSTRTIGGIAGIA